MFLLPFTLHACMGNTVWQLQRLREEAISRLQVEGLAQMYQAFLIPLLWCWSRTSKKNQMKKAQWIIRTWIPNRRCSEHAEWAGGPKRMKKLLEGESPGHQRDSAKTACQRCLPDDLGGATYSLRMLSSWTLPKGDGGQHKGSSDWSWHEGCSHVW